MFFNKPKETNKENILYISIDGRSIGLAFYTGKHCHYSERRIHISGETVKPIETLFKDIFYAFKHTNNKIIDEIIIILESPWVKEKNITIKESRQKAFQITEKTINEIINKNKKVEQNKDPELGLVVENVKLNGYKYENPIGKITEEIEIAVTHFHGDPEIISFFEESIKNFWGKTKITFMAGAEYIFNIAKENKVQNDMYMYLGTTDILMRLYSQGIVNKKITIPFGFQHLLERLNNTWSTNSTETKHWLELFISDSLNEDEKKRIEGDIRSTILAMVNLFNNSNKEGSPLSLERPISIYGGDKIWNDVFFYLLKNKYFGSIFPNIENTEIKPLESKIKDIKGDTLIAIYVNSIIKEDAKISS
jgi:hypothetical protein